MIKHIPRLMNFKRNLSFRFDKINFLNEYFMILFYGRKFSEALFYGNRIKIPFKVNEVVEEFEYDFKSLRLKRHFMKENLNYILNI